MPIELLLVVILKALAELAFMFLLGRALLYILAGRKRQGNIFYQLFCILTDPLLRAARWGTCLAAPMAERGNRPGDPMDG